jgi:hypothetical protein
MKSIIFWDMTPCSLLSYNRRFGGTYRLHLQGRAICLLVFAEIISPTLKMEAICSFETSVVTQQTTRRHVPEDDTLQTRYLFNKPQRRFGGNAASIFRVELHSALHMEEVCFYQELVRAYQTSRYHNLDDHNRFLWVLGAGIAQSV